WLLEPMRTGTPKKWSGTLQHPSHQGKLGVTLTTFVHFAYEWSQKTIVFADLQTSLTATSSRGKHILFDIMMHTMRGDSGLGDHGTDGIQQFIDQHICSNKCEDLGLQKLGPGSSRNDSGEDSGKEDVDDIRSSIPQKSRRRASRV
ncbi:hypothetical protein L218DRAFT_881696, partial [Marasmius fiardii PR-910]